MFRRIGDENRFGPIACDLWKDRLVLADAKPKADFRLSKICNLDFDFGFDFVSLTFKGDSTFVAENCFAAPPVHAAQVV